MPDSEKIMEEFARLLKTWDRRYGKDPPDDAAKCIAIGQIAARYAAARHGDGHQWRKQTWPKSMEVAYFKLRIFAASQNWSRWKGIDGHVKLWAVATLDLRLKQLPRYLLQPMMCLVRVTPEQAADGTWTPKVSPNTITGQPAKNKPTWTQPYIDKIVSLAVVAPKGADSAKNLTRIIGEYKETLVNEHKALLKLREMLSRIPRSR